MSALFVWLRDAKRALRRHFRDERGLSTTDLLTEAVLGAVALAAIGGLFQWLGADFLDEIQHHVAKL